MSSLINDGFIKLLILKLTTDVALHTEHGGENLINKLLVEV
jgi:hypothetical protein